MGGLGGEGGGGRRGRQCWIFTPLHLSPPFIGVFVSVRLKGVGVGGGASSSGCVNTLNGLSRTHSDTI